MAYPAKTFFGQHPNQDNVGIEIVAGRFTLGAGPAIGTVTGENFNVAYTTVGKYTLTLKKAYGSLISAVACLQQNTAGDQYALISDVDLVTANTVELNVWDISGTALADIAVD